MNILLMLLLMASAVFAFPGCRSHHHRDKHARPAPRSVAHPHPKAAPHAKHHKAPPPPAGYKKAPAPVPNRNVPPPKR